VVVKHLLLCLVAGDAHLAAFTPHDVVTAIDMRGELRLVFAAQMGGDDDARRPSTTPSASISTQSFFTSAGFSEMVRLQLCVGSVRSGGRV